MCSPPASPCRFRISVVPAGTPRSSGLVFRAPLPGHLLHVVHLATVFGSNRIGIGLDWIHVAATHLGLSEGISLHRFGCESKVYVAIADAEAICFAPSGGTSHVHYAAKILCHCVNARDRVLAACFRLFCPPNSRCARRFFFFCVCVRQVCDACLSGRVNCIKSERS